MTFAQNTHFRTLTCGGCHVLFAMTAAMYDALVAEKGSFYCPKGCKRHFTGGKSVEQMKRELQEKNDTIEKSLNRQYQLERDVEAQQKKHRALRTRIFNGKCPCCDQVFENLLQHMHADHADYISEDCTMAALREMFSMSQADVAREAGISSPGYVSNYENGRHVPEYAKQLLDNWVQQYVKREVVG